MNKSIPLSFTIVLPKRKFLQDQVVTIGQKPEVKAYKSENVNRRFSPIYLDVVVISETGLLGTSKFMVKKNDCTLTMFGHIEEEWDDTQLIYVLPGWVETTGAYGYYYEDDDIGYQVDIANQAEVPGFVENLPEDPSEFKVIDELYVPPLRLIYDDGETRFRMVWVNAVLAINGNPVHLCYQHDREYGYQFQTTCNHFWLENIDKGTTKQAKDALNHLQLFKNILAFQQIQKGGRHPRSRPEETVATYNKISNLRYSPNYRNRSDKEFLEDHPEFNQPQLDRVKKWRKQGKPGLK